MTHVACMAQRVIVLSLACLYVAIIWNSSFVLDGTRYFTLLDDAMISMRYAKHIAEGLGPVWNPGEAAIEGFSNPLWTLVMVSVHWTPLPARLASLPIQLLGALLLVVTLVAMCSVVRTLAPPRSSCIAACAYLLLAGTYAPTLSWSLQGSEVAAIAAGLAVSLAASLHAVRAGRFTAVPHVICALLLLVRLDALVPAGVLSLWIAWEQGSQLKRHAFAIAVLVGGTLIIQSLVRAVVFDAIVPNTYFLKLQGFPLGERLARGGLVLIDFAIQSWPAAVLAGLARLRRRDAVPFALVTCASAAYSLYCGGDAWEWWGGANRYLAPAFVVVLAIPALGLAYVASMTELRLWVAVPLAVVTAILLNSFNDGRGLRVLLLREAPLHARDNQATTALAWAVRRCTNESQVIAVDWAGIVPYFSERRVIDLLGKADPVVARQSMYLDRSKPLRQRFWPGHLKWNYERTIRNANPDVVAILTGGYVERARPYLEGRYITIAQVLHGEVAVSSTTASKALARCFRTEMDRAGVPGWRPINSSSM